MKKKQALHKTAVIKNELGLHARSAAQIAGIATNSQGNVWVMKNENKADASSIMDILTLVCEKGTKIKIFGYKESPRELIL